MSFTYKGVGVTLVRREPGYDPETGRRWEDQTYQGTKASVEGMTPALESAGYGWTIRGPGPVYEIQTRIPLNDESNEEIDRWEISTASKEISIFQHIDVVTEMAVYDAGLSADDADTFRKRAEDAVESVNIGLNGGATETIEVFNWVVDHLRNGVNSFQVDTLVLRRFRRISQEYSQGAGGKIRLDAIQYLYTTAQLNLPPSVAFNVPATPSGTAYPWRWLMRSQRVEIIGSMVEQTYELEFAEWSPRLFTNATFNLAW